MKDYKDNCFYPKPCGTGGYCGERRCFTCRTCKPLKEFMPSNRSCCRPCLAAKGRYRRKYAHDPGTFSLDRLAKLEYRELMVDLKTSGLKYNATVLEPSDPLYDVMYFRFWGRWPDSKIF